MATITIKTDTLIIGKPYSYKELCNELGEEEKKNREKQYSRWKRYFEFSRAGRKFYIIQIYDTPIADGRINGNNRKYLDIFKGIIIQYLNNSNKMIYHTQNNWLLNLKLVNENLFKDYKDLMKEYAYLYDIHGKFYFQNCQDEVKNFCIAKFNSAINSLEKANIINKFETYMIVEENSIRVANPTEKEEIDFIFEKVKKDLKLKSMRDANFKNKLGILYSRIDEEVNKEYGYIKVYKVLGLEKINNNENLSLLEGDNLHDELVFLIKEGLNKSFQNKKDNNTKNLEDAKNIIFEKFLNDEDYSNVNYPKFEFEDNYESIMNTLIDIFLSL